MYWKLLKLMTVTKNQSEMCGVGEKMLTSLGYSLSWTKMRLHKNEGKQAVSCLEDLE